MKNTTPSSEVEDTKTSLLESALIELYYQVLSDIPAEKMTLKMYKAMENATEALGLWSEE